MNATKRIIPIIITAIIIISVASTMGWFGFGNGKAEKEAQAYVNKKVYSSLGVPAKNYSTKVIYNKNEEKLIIVKYSIENDSNWGGSCCVYYKSGSVMSSTAIMAPEYDYQSNIDSLKAIFGIY